MSGHSPAPHLHVWLSAAHVSPRSWDVEERAWEPVPGTQRGCSPWARGQSLGTIWSTLLLVGTKVESGYSRTQMPRQAWAGWFTEAQGGGEGQEKGEECS